MSAGHAPHTSPPWWEVLSLPRDRLALVWVAQAPGLIVAKMHQPVCRIRGWRYEG